jgi:hypothetical protein
VNSKDGLKFLNIDDNWTEKDLLSNLIKYKTIIESFPIGITITDSEVVKLLKVIQLQINSLV